MKTLFSILGLLSVSVVVGQYTPLGEASRIVSQCYQLTPDSISGYGKIVSTRTHNLATPFTLYTEMYFGDQDLGGNGIVFFFQASQEVDIVGDTIYGIGNSTPSINIELDTKQDSVLGDPFFDHVSLMQNGNFSHQSSDQLLGPISVNAVGDIEDGEMHDVKIDWNPTAQRLSLSVDCQELINYEGDLVNDIFGGISDVFFGFSAGSFSSFNRHEVCVEITTQSDLLQDVTICQEGQTWLNAITGGQSYSWSPSEGLNADNVARPIANPTESTSYVLEVETGSCDEVLNYVVNVDVAPIEGSVDLGKDTTLCVGDNYLLDATTPNATGYRWSNGTRDSILTVSRTALYRVTVTFDDACIAEDAAIIRFNEPPLVLLGNDTTICQNSNGFFLKPILDADVNFTWSTGSTADSLRVNRSGFFSVLVENECGTSEADIFVFSENCQDFYIPNAFTPNADGFNDEMYPYTEPGDINQISNFSIYNRWGNLMHEVKNGEPNNRSLGWDGKINGKPAAKGVYMYKLILQFRDGQETLIKGDFTLL